MRVAIVGIGSIGSLYADYLSDVGYETVLVDSDGRFDHKEVTTVLRVTDVDVWIIATPTSTHMEVAQEILRSAPDAAILLEKPACYPAQISTLARAASGHPKARLLVNDVYAYSGAVHTLATAVREQALTDPIVRVAIEFSKNRVQDVENGRFVDTVYGEIGYEWFHMLSILRMIVPPDIYRRYLRTPPSVVTTAVRTEVTLPDGLSVVLHSSVLGVLGLPELGLRQFTANAPARHLKNRFIPYGSNFRYRAAAVEFRSGATVTMLLEPHYGRTVDYKNEHVVEVCVNGKIARHDITENHLRRALLHQIDELLLQLPGDSEPLRLDEHRHMADLADLLRLTNDRQFPITA